MIRLRYRGRNSGLEELILCIIHDMVFGRFEISYHIIGNKTIELDIIFFQKEFLDLV